MTKKIGVLLILFFLFIKPAFCGSDPLYIEGITAITEGAVFEVKDLVYIDPVQKANVSHILSVKDVISFKLRNDVSYNYYNANLKCKIRIRIEKWGWNDVNPQQEEVDLEVEYLVNGQSKTEAHYKLENVHKLRITVLDVPAEFEQNMPPVFMLSGEIYVDRKFHFNPDLENGIKLADFEPASEPTKAAISWQPKEYPGAEEFDLEWTFVDLESTFGTTLTNLTPADIQAASFDESVARYMRFNSTRVTIPNNGSDNLGHTINLTAAEGFLLFRIRAIQYHHPSGNRIESKWAYKYMAPTGLKKFFVLIPGGHEDKFNWQTSVSYAEEGKSKEVVSYFDGLLKSRQTITLSNTSPVAVAQENVYDQYGRPALSVIPAPINAFDLKFKPLLNQKSSGGVYSYTELSVNSDGKLVAAPMGTQDGASKYYSPSNPFLGESANRHIPNAESFPFSVTQYTSDNTGRIKSQGGVGVDFQLDAHATNYYYSKPSQSELYRMFGKEVGNHQHYLKNMVVDPNGQVSISYINSSGKTIATSLAGKGPDNLDKLPSQFAPESQRTMDDELVSAGTYIVDRDKFVIRFSTSFLAAMPGDYTLMYTVTPEMLETLHGPEGQLKICNDCYYTAKMVVTDDNGKIVLDKLLGTLTTNYNTDCSTPANGLTGEELIPNMEIGKYSVEYEIIADKAALKAYWEHQITNNTDIRKVEDFKREYIRNTDYTGCFTDCKSCLETLGDFSKFESAVKEAFANASLIYADEDDGDWALQLYNNLLANCNSLPCPEESPCQVYLDRILNDVRPGGQYALYDKATMALIEPEINVIGKRANREFLDENGQPDFVTVENGQVLTPAQLSNEQFIKYFKPSWAMALATLHPEYCYYQYCVDKNTGGERFSRKIENVTKVAEAISAGWFSTTNDHYYELMLDADDFYKTGNPGAPFREEVRNQFNNYFIDQNTFTARSVKQFVDQLLYCTPNNSAYPNCPAPAIECRNLDLEWNTFRNIYLSVKQSYADKARKQTPGFGNCTNCNIGTTTPTFEGQPPLVNASYIPAQSQSSSHQVGSTPPNQCNGVTMTTSILSAEMDHVLVGLQLSATTNKFVSTILTVLGSLPGETEKQVISSKVVVVPPNTTSKSEYFELMNKNQSFTNIEVKISSLNCNTCNAGYYKINGQDVYVSFGGEVPPSGYGLFSFYSNVTVDIPSGGSCTFSNVSVSKKKIENVNCPEKSGVGQFRVNGSQGENRGFCSETWTDVTLKECTENYEIRLNGTYSVPVGVDIKVSYSVSDDFCSGDRPVIIGETISFSPGETLKLFTFTFKTEDFCFSSVEVLNVICQPVVSCPPVPNAAILARKRKAFPSVNDFGIPGSQGNYQEMEDAVINAAMENSVSCESRAEWILNKLINGCTILTTDAAKLNALRLALINNCDSYRLPPDGVWYRDENLRQTIESILGVSALNSTCNDLILESIRPNGKQPIKPVAVYSLSEISSCALDHIQRWNNEFIANSAGYDNLRDYIRGVGSLSPYHISDGQQYKIGSVFNMSQEDLTVLINAMNNGCNFLTKTIFIPPYLQCNQLLSFPEFQQLKSEFGTAYPYVQATDKNYWDLLSTFINHKYGTDYAKSDLRAYALSANPQDHMMGYDFAETYPQQPDLYKCLKEQIEFANTQAINDYNIYIEEQRLIFYKRYTDKCLGISPSLRLVATNVKEYHYTLYYYDQSANLVKTVPPSGVKLLNENQVSQLLADPEASISPNHTMSTVYMYNSLNQVVWQKSPDGGHGRFWYDALGRLVASQNDVQLPDQAFSYTMYDAQGRIIEVGEKKNPSVSLGSSTGSLHEGQSAIANLQVNCCHVATIDEYTANQSITFDPGFDSDVDDYFETHLVNGTNDSQETIDEFYASGSNDQVTRTQYDESDLRLNPDPEIDQANLRKRVAVVSYWETGGTGPLIPISATHYSYDVAGNVNRLWQESKAMKDVDVSHRYKALKYDFDLVSGKVNKLSYQDGRTDAFFYKYTYDAENRLIGAYSSTDNIIWKREADYRYYLHGPLMRTELGDNKTSAIVQGIDYTYTLQGWLKSINGKLLGHANDPGMDANPGNSDRKNIPEDVLGYSLYYHNNDFKAIGESPINVTKYRSVNPATIGAELFNGNISATSYVNKNLENALPVGYSYRYDQLNRIINMRRTEIGTSGANWNYSGGNLNRYREDYTYDGIGNIQTLKRYGNGVMINDMSYVYKSANNQLRHVKDAYEPQQTDHYKYDATGNLIQEGDDMTINWTVYGKIRNINKATGSSITYKYDPSGNRISKDVENALTHYVRDAQGNVIAVYTSDNTNEMKLAEVNLFGSSRLGAIHSNLSVPNAGVNTFIGHDSYITGKKFFELTNHLGNVMATISDKKTGVALESDATVVDHYSAEVVTAQDYYPFGMFMPERKVSTEKYRYGFNGQEMSNEIKGVGNSYTAKFWEYDPRIGRRWNLDPIRKSWQSDYSTFSNSPIWKMDPDGDDDFFNANGTFAYRTKTGTNIKILTKGGEKLLSQVLPNNPANIKALAKVVAYYAPRAAIPAGTKVGISPNNDGIKEKGQGRALAFTGQDGIMVNAKGGIDPSLNNYNNLTSTLHHEENHRKEGDLTKGRDYKFTDHTYIYEKQIDDNSFKSADSEFKIKMAGSYVSYLLGALDKGEIDDSDFDAKIQSMNSKLKPYGINISTQRSSAPLPAMQVTGKDNQGKAVKNAGGFIIPKTDPH